ncbi:MAG TPA: hypothetical protein P5571_07950 [Candidatus Krumholzibacteria bacterium]|nr:hypothetical protein [Candidatus Krumholzibacteria bacterium]HRX51277.1 hypothetical protein [Candidatus Krumholzibacteria bacterium]
MKSLRPLMLCAAVTALTAAPALADVIVPDEWVGIWELQIASYDCDTDVLLFESTEYDSICPGWAFSDPVDEEVEITCTGSANADGYEQHCSGSSEPLPGCTIDFAFDAAGTRTGDTYTAITTITTTATGSCMGFQGSCQRIEVTGTRIDATPPDCSQTPAETWSWSAVKEGYR